MPYITSDQYNMVRDILEPKIPRDNVGLRELQARIFALNRKIRAVPGDSPTPEWRKLVSQQKILTDAYWAAANGLAKLSEKPQQNSG